MSGIYDVHTHLNDSIYAENNFASSELIMQARNLGVDIINIIGFDVNSSKVAIRQASQYNRVFALVGIHPNEVHYSKLDDLKIIEEIANSKEVVGIGEIGLDYCKAGGKYRKEQIKFFKKQIEIAKNLNLPIMIHIKDKDNKTLAYEDAYKILVAEDIKNVIIHAYEGNEEFAQKFLDLGYLLSFDGKITYENSHLEDLIRNISLNQILVETDSPYHAPVPYQKEINYPKYAKLIVDKIAQIKKVDTDEIISATRVNGQTFFKINN